MTIEEKPTPTQKWVQKLTLPVFIFSMLFMVTCANRAVNNWPSPWNQLSITIACLFPLFLASFNNLSKWLKGKKIRSELLFILIIIILGILNVAFGEERYENFKGMGLFLLSGVTIFTTTVLIVKSYKAQSIFYWFCTLMLLTIALNSFYSPLRFNYLRPLFSNNPIPESVIVTLLLAGPLLLLGRQKTTLGRVIIIFFLLLGAASIVAIQQRAAIASLIIMIILLGFLIINRFWIYLLCAIITISISFNIKPELYKELPENSKKFLKVIESIPAVRMEMYYFAYHLIKKKPWLGTGLWAPLSHHLPDYKGSNLVTSKHDKRLFFDVVDRDNTSFHNILLCMFVQMGSIFAITYLALLGYIFFKVFQNHREPLTSHSSLKPLMVLFFGFFIQSMFLDTLMYPDINFLFHSLLGVLANLTNKTHDTLNGARD